MPTRNILLPTALLFASPSAFAQFSFSIDFHGPTRSAADCSGTGAAITEGDVLRPCTGSPAMPVTPAPLQRPQIFIPGGPGGLGLMGACIGAAPGSLCAPGMEMDALSYGFDDVIDDFIFVPGSNFTRKANYHFSVDEWAVGAPVGMEPNVFSEATVGDIAADVFVDDGFDVPPPFAPFGGGVPGNIANVDGDGRPQFPTYWAYPGIGLREPSGPGTPPDNGDNLDALDVSPATVTGSFPVFFSLDAEFLDPRNGFPNSASAVAHGFSGADVLVSPAAGGPPVLYAPAAVLGLDLAGPDTDDLDALILHENNMPGFQPSFAPYDWITAPNNVDMMLFSVRTGSAVIGQPDSRYGLPIEPGDILVPPLPTFSGGVSPYPAIWIPAEDLGLEVSFARGGAVTFGDDIDALDYARNKQLLEAEYCYGDGGLAGCTACPCGNDAAAGTQAGCLNSAGTGARLEVSGLACVTNDTLRFELLSATPNSFALLLTGANRLPLAGPCPPGSGISPINLDGLRCMGGGLRRLGVRPTDANGDVGITNNGWGPPSGPAGGLLNFAGYAVPCVPTQWQAFYRDDPTVGCNTGVNTSQGIQVILTP